MVELKKKGGAILAKKKEYLDLWDEERYLKAMKREFKIEEKYDFARKLLDILNDKTIAKVADISVSDVKWLRENQ